MPISAGMRWSWGRAICGGAHRRFSTVRSGRPVQHLDARLVRLADRAHQRGGVGDGARHDLLHGLPRLLGKRGAKIGDELVEVEHGRDLTSLKRRPEMAAHRPPARIGQPYGTAAAQLPGPAAGEEVSAMAAPSAPEMCGRRSLQSRHWRAKWRLPARRAPGTSTPILWQNSSPVSVSVQSRGPLGSIWPPWSAHR